MNPQAFCQVRPKGSSFHTDPHVNGMTGGWQLDDYKVGPLLVINGVITPISMVITPVTHL